MGKALQRMGPAGLQLLGGGTQVWKGSVLVGFAGEIHEIHIVFLRFPAYLILFFRHSEEEITPLNSSATPGHLRAGFQHLL